MTLQPTSSSSTFTNPSAGLQKTGCMFHTSSHPSPLSPLTQVNTRAFPSVCPITVNPFTKFLGERGMTFRHHMAEVNFRGKSRLNAMRALSPTTFGHSKEQQTTFCKQPANMQVRPRSPISLLPI